MGMGGVVETGGRRPGWAEEISADMAAVLSPRKWSRAFVIASGMRLRRRTRRRVREEGKNERGCRCG